MTSGTSTCSVKYDQAADSNYNPAPQVTETVNALKAGQTITVNTHAPASAAYNTGFGVAATGGGSGRPGDLLLERVLLEHGRHLHDDKRHRHLQR